MLSNISSSENVNITPGGQVPLSFNSESDWNIHGFLKNYSTRKNHFNEEREIPIIPSKYVHARLECCDYRFPANW